MVYEEEDHASAQQAEHVLGEQVGGGDRVRRIHDRRDDQKAEGGGDRVPRVDAGPDRVDEVHPQEEQKDLEVGDRHPPAKRRGCSKCLGPVRRGLRPMSVIQPGPLPVIFT